MAVALSSETVFGALCEIESQHSATLAVVCGTNRWTYRELLVEVKRVAAALLAAGVASGDRVAMLCSTRVEFWITFLASSAVGAIWVGLGVRNRRAELRHLVSDCEPRLLICLSELSGRSYLEDARALREGCPSIREVITIGSGGPDFTPWNVFLSRGQSVSADELEETAARVPPRDPALMVYTSGTTGLPKGALLSHYGLIVGNRAQNERRLGVRMVMINSFPINHIACVGDTSIAIMVAAGTAILTERFNPREQLELIERERVTVWGGIPAMVQQTLAVPDFDRFDLSSLRAVGWGGGAMPRDIIERLQQLAPRVGAVYGLTESTCNVTWTEPGASLEVLISTIGKPGSAFPCRVRDESGHICGVGEPGEIEFHASTNMLGYWRREQATREAFTTDGWLRTGDLGVWRSDGNLTLVGRRFEMFKSGGFNVYPREVEIALESHAAVECAAVVPKPDRLYNEVGHAFIVLRGANRPSVADIEAYLRGRLANYKIPKTIESVAALPILENGKVDKVLLREQARRAADDVAQLK